ncbi:glycerate kinase [Thermoactinomyces daqus]|uniref:Glycerate kinase n=1 Tax=Thermoactinomyces daqus TaxID=1329516 RepID=A0A7W2AHG6_9BACL|nr:glycerate kinase [Thermoactinomyces daqus]MBA4541679.1 glycerate kinase [Thermoactinomyces daqus]
MRIIIAPDSYKGSLPAKEVGLTIMKAFTSEIPEAEVTVIPMADGGEGTIDAVVYATGGKTQSVEVAGPLLKPVTTCYGVIDKQTAVIETANIAGLPMVPKNERNPLHTSTLGIGQAIRHALDQGYRRFIVGLGGSATNDGGMGMLQAPGATFLDAQNQPLPPVGISLDHVVKTDLSGLDPRLFESEILVASDVQNPLCGDQGATSVFGPQKGATPEQLKQLERGMQKYARCLETLTGRSLQTVPGAGAAGGLVFAFLLLQAKIKSGAKLIADLVHLEEKIAGADWVITGEGKTDFQTQYGKLPVFVAQLAQKHGAKALLLSGSIEPGAEALSSHFVSLHSIQRRPLSLEEAMDQTASLLMETARNLARLIKVCS